MVEFLKSLLMNPKIVAILASAIVAALAHFGFDLPIEIASGIVLAVTAFVGGQKRAEVKADKLAEAEVEFDLDLDSGAR